MCFYRRYWLPSIWWRRAAAERPIFLQVLLLAGLLPSTYTAPFSLAARRHPGAMFSVAGQSPSARQAALVNAKSAVLLTTAAVSV
jgi:hypothetical protein